MLKTIKLLKDKQVVKKAAIFSVFATLVSLIAMAASLKLGINKWKTYNDPITWNELYLRIPHLLLIGLAIFIFLFIWSLHDKWE